MRIAPALLLARARPLEGLGNTGHAAPDKLQELRAEALARLQAVREAPPAGAVPQHLLVLALAQAHAIVVDASRSRVYVYQNDRGELRLVADYYGTLGKQGIDKLREGDQKTPLGVYHVTSMIRGAKLPDLYGWGAFPINYPNDWDRRAGKTGYQAARRAARELCARSARERRLHRARQRRDRRSRQARAAWLNPRGHRRARRLGDARAIARRARALHAPARGLAHRLGKPRYREVPLPLCARLPRRRDRPRRLERSQTQGECGQELDQDRPVERERAAFRRRGRGHRSDFRPGLPLQQPLSARAQAPVLGRAGGQWKIAYENTVGGQKLRLPESFKSAVRAKGARS